MSSLSDRDIRLEQVITVILEQLKNGHTVRYYPKGTSMRPMLRQGIDSVEFAPLPGGKLKKYDLPLYQRENGQYVLHRIVKVEDTYTCIGDNQYVYEPGVTQDQLLAIVTGYYRGEKFRSIDSFAYKCYCRYWHGTRGLRHFRLRVKNKLKRIINRK